MDGCLLAAAGALLPGPAFAKYGDSAKIAPGIQELKDAVTGKTEADQGPSLYDKESIRLQEERIANQWMRLEQACMLVRELLAEPAEILADELRLFGECKRFNDELPPGEPRADGFE